MNIDILINKYYLAVRELRKEENKNNKSEHNKSAHYRKKATIIMIMTIMIISFLVFVLGLFYLRNMIISTIGIAVLLIVSLIIIAKSSSEKEIKDWIHIAEKYNKKKMSKLEDLFKESKINIDTNTINKLIMAAESNKQKYDYFREERKIVALLCSMIGVFFTSLTAISDIRIADNQITSIIIIGMLCIVFSVSLYYVSIVELDPLLRRRYHFHDEFIYDLTQLSLFQNYYMNNE